MKKFLPNGFTLIELLVVIAIIAILSAIGFVSYSSFLKNARDVKRQSDLKFIQSALEEYFADQKYYPVFGENSCDKNNPQKDGNFRLGCPLTNPTGSKTYLNQIPNENYNYQPITYNNYNCNNVADLCANYCLYTKMEKIQGSTGKSEDEVLCNVKDDPNYNYAVTKP